MEWFKGMAGRVKRPAGERGEDEAEAPSVPEPAAPLLETPQERRERWRSVYVIYFTMFQMSLGFSIVLTGVWPYLDKVSAPQATSRYYLVDLVITELVLSVSLGFFMMLTG